MSPKNILRGPGRPVFLDAECACWGDPAFDLVLIGGTEALGLNGGQFDPLGRVLGRRRRAQP